MELDDVLEMMHLARRRYATIQARVRRRVDARVWSEASRRRAVDLQRTFGLFEALDHIWFESPSRYRIETESGTRAGFVHVQNGPRTHRFDPNDAVASGTRTNVSFGDAETTYRQVMWEPNLLIPEMWLVPTGQDEVAARNAATVRGLPRWTSHDYFIVTPADSYELTVDLERGVLLRLVLLYGGQVGISDEVVEATFDEPLPETLLDMPDAGE